MAWLGLGGKVNPWGHAKRLQREAERKRRQPCPCPEYADEVLGTDRVGKRFFGGRFDLAHQARAELPALFARLLQYANAEIEAEPLALETARHEAERKSEHDNLAKRR